MSDYIDVMRGIHYVHRKADDLNLRTFHLTCSKENGQIVSNELVVEVRVYGIILCGLIGTLCFFVSCICGF